MSECPICSQPIGELQTEASRKEAEYSGMCDSCQQDFFGSEPKVEKVASAPEPEPEVEVDPNKLPDWILGAQDY